MQEEGEERCSRVKQEPVSVRRRTKTWHMSALLSQRRRRKMEMKLKMKMKRMHQGFD